MPLYQVQLLVHVPDRRHTGKTAFFLVVPRIVAGTERALPGQGTHRSQAGGLPADLDVHAAVGQDRQVSGHVQVVELPAKPRIRIGPAAGGGRQEGSVGTGHEDDVETPRQACLVEIFRDHQAEFPSRSLIAEPVHHRGDVVLAGAGRAVRVIALDPAADEDRGFLAVAEDRVLQDLLSQGKGVGPSGGSSADARFREPAGAGSGTGVVGVVTTAGFAGSAGGMVTGAGAAPEFCRSVLAGIRIGCCAGYVGIYGEGDWAWDVEVKTHSASPRLKRRVHVILPSPI